MIYLSRASDILFSTAFKPIIDHTGSFLSNRVVMTALKFSAPMLAIALLVEGVTKAMKKMGYDWRESSDATPSTIALAMTGSAALSFTACRLLQLDEAATIPVILGLSLGATTGDFLIYSSEKAGVPSWELSAVSIGSLATGLFLYSKAMNSL